MTDVQSGLATLGPSGWDVIEPSEGGKFGPSPVSGVVLGTYGSVAALESAYPAASNAGRYATVGASKYQSDGTLWLPGTAARVLAQSAIPITLTGTTSGTVMGSLVVPAGCMGINGSLRLTVAYSMTNNANVKTMLIRWGGSVVTFFSASLGSQATEVAQLFIQNRGATGSQLMSGPGTPASYGSGLPAFATASEDTTVQQQVQFVGVLSNAVDAMTIERYCLELLP